MKHGPKWSTVTIALALIVIFALVSPALGGPSLRKLVKNEVAKQISKAIGPAGANGNNGANGTNGTARAYARVRPNASFPCAPDCTVDKATGITEVTNTSTGHYCVTAPGIDARTEPAAVTVDWFYTNGPEGNASAMANDNCAGSGFGVQTDRRGATTDAVAADDVAFTIVIP
jgi:hypothetical protein